MSQSGVVKMFNNAKGFGFICPDEGGEDLFVHRNEVADGQLLLEGDQVRYDEKFDDRKGKQNAANVTGGSGGVDPGPPPKGGGKGKFGGGGGGYGGGGGGGFGGGGGGGFRGGGNRGPGGGANSGTVKFFNDTKGFGFITPDNGGADLFVHRNEVSDGQALLEGDQVQFDEQYDDRSGKQKASNVTGGSGGDDQGPPPKGGGKGKFGGGGGYGGGGFGGGGGYGGGGYGGGGYGGGGFGGGGF